MNISGDFPLQFQLGPPELTNGLNIPGLLLVRQLRLQNNDILRPANGHGLDQHLRRIFIGKVKLPHPAEISGGEAGDVRVSFREVFGGGDSGAFLCPGTEELTNFMVQFYLFYLLQRY